MNQLPLMVLVLAGLGFAGFGAWLLFDPGGLARVDIVAAAPQGLVELRAFYGGCELGLGLFLLACAARPDWREAGLWLALLANGVTGLARVAGIAAAGWLVTPFLGWALVWEFGFAIASALALRQLR
jgi:hypothetical protein